MLQLKIMPQNWLWLPSFEM